MSSQIREPITDIRACAWARAGLRARLRGGWNQINYLHSPGSTTRHPSQRLESQPLSAHNQNTTKRRINAPHWWSQQTPASEWRKRRAAGRRLWSHVRSHSVQLFRSAEDLGNQNNNIPLRSESDQDRRATSSSWRTAQVQGQLQLLRLQRTHSVLLSMLLN